MRAEWGDAKLGIMGILGTVRIMGNVGAALDGRCGLPGRWGGEGVQGWLAFPWHAGRGGAGLK